MSPYYSYGVTTQTNIGSSGTVSTSASYFGDNIEIQKEKPESKKQKKDRVSKEKMLASWQLFNQKPLNVKEVKQICKPRHVLNHSGNRR